MFDESLCQQGKNFANKIWNAFRLVKGWEPSDIPQPEASRMGIAWYRAKFQQTLAEIDDHYAKFRISDALMATYKLVWDDFCSWLLEIVKPPYQEGIDSRSLEETITFFEEILRVLHPFMPFLTEEIWQRMAERTPENALIVSNWPEKTSFDSQLVTEFEWATAVIAGIRTIRKEKNIPMKEALDLYVLYAEDTPQIWNEIIMKLTHVKKIEKVETAVDGALSFRVRSNEYFIPVSGAVDLLAEIEKLRDELTYTRGFLQSVQRKLSNERFINNAPEQVVAMEKKKAADAEAKIETLQKSLASLE
jgi:valyl-tRNA synthetase